MQYFAQDEATRARSDADRLRDARRRLADRHGAGTSATSSAASCSRATTSTSRCGVLSGGERTRLAVARMLLRPSNTLLLDEPTNHLDLDSKDVLLDALEDFGGTLIFVSHDRYFVDKLATKIIEIGHGDASVYPGTYEEFLWSKKQRAAQPCASAAPGQVRGSKCRVRSNVRREDAASNAAKPTDPEASDTRPRHRRRRSRSYDDKKQARRRSTASRERRSRRGSGGSTSSRRGSPRPRQAIKELEAQMSAPGFYENHETSKPVIDRHQALMWEVGDLMNKWEALQAQTEV